LNPNIQFFILSRKSDGEVSPPMHPLWLGWKGYTYAALLLAKAPTNRESRMQP